MGLTEFRRRIEATYSSNDLLADPELGDYRPKPPPQQPTNSDGENPGSTGFATGGDPPEFDRQLSTHVQSTPFAAAFVGELHPPEPALPRTTGEDEETPGERYRDQMSAEVTDLHMPPTGQHTALATARTTDEIIAAFQATAAGKALSDQKGPDAMDIASAARSYLADGPAAPGMSKTALKEFSFAEQQALINEGSVDGTRARNLGDLKIEGTHYEAIEAALAAQGATEDAEDLFT